MHIEKYQAGIRGSPFQGCLIVPNTLAMTRRPVIMDEKLGCQGRPLRNQINQDCPDVTVRRIRAVVIDDVPLS